MAQEFEPGWDHQKRGKERMGLTNWKHPDEYNKGYKRDSQYIGELMLCALQSTNSCGLSLSFQTLFNSGLWSK